MNWILTMSLSGSCMLLLYCLFYVLQKASGGYLSERLAYFMLKVALFYYLVPLPFLKVIYNDFFWYFANPSKHYLGSFSQIENNHITYVLDGKPYYSQSVIVSLSIIGLWLAVSLFFLVLKIMKTKKFIREVSKNSLQITNAEEVGAINNLAKEYHIRRRVTVFLCHLPEVGSFTYGILRPIILIPSDMAESKRELVIRHEMVHIKQNDLLVHMLSSFAVSFHWFNPFIYYHQHLLRQRCEYVCDERVLRGIEEEQRFLYAEEIVRQAAGKEFLVSSLTGEGKQVEKRIRNIVMKSRSVSSFQTVVGILGAIIFIGLNSLTVYSYDNTVKIDLGQGNGLGEETIFFSEAEYSEFSTISLMADVEKEVMKYGDYFWTGEGGESYQYDGIPVNDLLCKHSYEKGEWIHHEQEESGCCFSRYEAKRCNECGYVVIGNKIQISDYGECSH